MVGLAENKANSASLELRLSLAINDFIRIISATSDIGEAPDTSAKDGEGAIIGDFSDDISE